MTRSRCVHVLLHPNTRDYKNIGPGPCIIIRELRYDIYTCSVADPWKGPNILTLKFFGREKNKENHGFTQTQNNYYIKVWKWTSIDFWECGDGRILEFFLNKAELSLNSGKLINHQSMHWAQFIDPVSHMCLAGAVVASQTVTEEMAGSSPF